MPVINEDGTITISQNSVKNLRGKPGDKVVIIETLVPETCERESHTSLITVMLESEWRKRDCGAEKLLPA